MPRALELLSCSSRRWPEEDVMLRTSIQAGCIQVSERSGECYRRESVCVLTTYVDNFYGRLLARAVLLQSLTQEV